MTQLIAIHEIHRPDANGKPEVIAPGTKFKATEEEVEMFVDQFGAARKATSADKGAPEQLAVTGDSTEKPADINKMNKADLLALAEKEEIAVAGDATVPQLRETIAAAREAKKNELI